MKIFLSALEASNVFETVIEGRIDRLYYTLMSYYYIRNTKKFKRIIDLSEEVMIDSGAHSFQKGAKVDWEVYTKEYAEWIYNNDEDKILGYFEMDIDPAGYPIAYVERLRSILERKSDKIIPVWHKGRGIEAFKKMCRNPRNRNRIVAITGFKNEDIKDEQYKMFVDYAHAQNCRIHCLGMTRKKILDKVPFDYVDSSSWKQQVLFGRVGRAKIGREFSKVSRNEAMYYSYLDAMKMQIAYRFKYKELWENENRENTGNKNRNELFENGGD